jgi:ketosteroid isomerase-like protein
MSQQNVQTIQRAYEAFNRQDIPGVLAVFDPQIEWVDQGGGRAPAGTFHGPQSVANDVFSIIPQNFDEFRADAEEFIDAGDHVVVVGRMRGKPKSGSALDARCVHVWRMRDGKATGFRHFVDANPWTKAWGG